MADEAKRRLILCAARNGGYVEKQRMWGAKKRDVGSCSCRNQTMETGLQNDVFCTFVDFVSFLGDIQKQMMS